MSNNTEYRIDAESIGAKMVKFGFRWVVTVPADTARAVKDHCKQSGAETVTFTNVKCGSKTLETVQVTNEVYVTKAGEVWSKPIDANDESKGLKVALRTAPRPKTEGETVSTSKSTSRSNGKGATTATVSADAAQLLAALAQAQGVSPADLLAQLSAGKVETMTSAVETPAPSAPKGSRPAKRQAAAAPAPAQGKGDTLDDLLA